MQLDSSLPGWPPEDGKLGLFKDSISFFPMDAPHHRGVPILQFFLRTLHPRCLVEILRCGVIRIMCSLVQIGTSTPTFSALGT